MINVRKSWPGHFAWSARHGRDQTRRGGLSVPQISYIVGVSLATVQRYCRFAQIRPEELRTAEERRLQNISRSWKTFSWIL
jgi:hypothetical protein